MFLYTIVIFALSALFDKNTNLKKRKRKGDTSASVLIKEFFYKINIFFF